MELGFMADHTKGGVAKPEWAEGPAEHSFGLGGKIRGRERFAMRTYRCSRCGCLESYAG